MRKRKLAVVGGEGPPRVEEMIAIAVSSEATRYEEELRHAISKCEIPASLPFNHTPPRIMIVECDGHDFHERTKDQARRDKKRDRFFQSKGFKVLRYTGSEIWADPEKCADEILEELARWDSWRANH